MGDGAALVGALVQLMENAPLRAAMGIRGREIAVSEFSLERVITANLDIYRALLSWALPLQTCFSRRVLW
jgi:glycosyltransferase involved in cell wall biosynthesis